MSRTALSYEEVTTIIQQIITSGERPTINRIREALNNQGSVPLIARYLKQWREENGQQLSLDMVQEMPIEKEKSTAPTEISLEDVQQPANIPAPPTEPVMTHIPMEPSQTPFQPPVVEEERDTPPTAAPATQAAQTQQAPRQPRHPHKNGQHNRQRRHYEQEAPEDFISNTAPTPRVVDFDKPYPAVPADVQEFLDQPFVEPEKLDANSLEALVALTKEALITRVRYLNALVSKEQTRANTYERIARDASVYSDSIREMVAERINATRDNMQATIDQLKLQYSQLKEQTEKELLGYQKQLDLANRKLVEQLPPTTTS